MSTSRSAGLRTLTGLTYVYLYVPILVLMVFSFNTTESNSLAPMRGFGFGWYEKAWNDPAMIRGMRNSLLAALASSAACCVLAIPAALALGRYKFRGRTILETFFYLPLIVPEVVIGLASAALFRVIGVQLGLTSVIFAHIAFGLSYAVLAIRTRLTTLDERYTEASMDLGAGPWATFLHVTLPLLAPGVISAGLLVFTVSLDDYVITRFVAGPDGRTLPLEIYALIARGVTPEVNAVATVLLIATAVMVFVSMKVQQAARSRGGLIAVGVVLLGLVGLAARSATQGAEQPRLLVYTWSNYTPDRMVKEFERRFNCSVVVVTFENNEAMHQGLSSGQARYDIIVPSDYMVARLVRENRLLELDRRKLTNFDNLDHSAVGLYYDPHNRFSVPYTMLITGIGYLKSEVDAPTSWSALFDPKYKDRLTMLDDMRECFAAALRVLGHPHDSTDPAHLDAALALLEKQKPSVQGYSSENFDRLLRERKAHIVQGYSGAIGKQMVDDADIGFAVPKEGATLAIDNLCIPINAEHPDLAHEFINMMMAPEWAAEIANDSDVRYRPANSAALPFVHPHLRRNPAIFPSDDDMSRCKLLRDIGPAIREYDRRWVRIKAASD